MHLQVHRTNPRPRPSNMVGLKFLPLLLCVVYAASAVADTVLDDPSEWARELRRVRGKKKSTQRKMSPPPRISPSSPPGEPPFLPPLLPPSPLPPMPLPPSPPPALTPGPCNICAYMYRKSSEVTQEDCNSLARQLQESYFTRPDIYPSSANVTFKCTFFSKTHATACTQFNSLEGAQLFQGNLQYLGIRNVRYPGLASVNDLKCSQSFVDNIKVISSCSGNYVLLRQPESVCWLHDPPPPPSPPQPPSPPPPPPPQPPAPVVPKCQVCHTLVRAKGGLTGSDCSVLAKKAFQYSLTSDADFYSVSECTIILEGEMKACGSFVSEEGMEVYMKRFEEQKKELGLMALFDLTCTLSHEDTITSTNDCSSTEVLTEPEVCFPWHDVPPPSPRPPSPPPSPPPPPPSPSPPPPSPPPPSPPPPPPVISPSPPSPRPPPPSPPPPPPSPSPPPPPQPSPRPPSPPPPSPKPPTASKQPCVFCMTVHRYGRPFDEAQCKLLATTLANLNLYVFRSPFSLQTPFNCYTYQYSYATACATFNSKEQVEDFNQLLSPAAEDPFPANIIIDAMDLKCAGGPTSKVTGLGGGQVDMFESTTGCDVPGWLQVPVCPV